MLSFVLLAVCVVVPPSLGMAVTLYGADGTPYILSAAPAPIIQQSSPAYYEPTLFMTQPQVSSSVSYQSPQTFTFQQQPAFQQRPQVAVYQPQPVYQQPQPVYQQPQPMMVYQQPQSRPSYQMQQQQRPSGYSSQPSQPMQSYQPAPVKQRSYGGGGYEEKKPQKKKKKKVEKIYVPVHVKRKKKKKMKIIQVQPGFFIQGGSQLFGKYKTLKSCQKACAATPYCFAADYNPWLKKCYLHSNVTACDQLHAHKKLIHFKKVPCFIPEAPEGLVTLGAQLFRGIEQKGIKSLTDCIKKCATAGLGIPESVVDIADQLCFGIDYDFGTHKCYFHVDNENDRICPPDGSTPNTPRDLVANPSVVNILLCPGP